MSRLDEDYAHIAVEFGRGALNESDAKPDAFDMLQGWLAEAVAMPEDSPTAMALSTSTFKGYPSSRIVLLKRLDAQGLYFYSNYESKKGVELLQNPYASALFFWPKLERQVRVAGKVARLEEILSDTYFAQRKEEVKLGAWASPQSQVIPSRKYLDRLAQDFREEFNGKEIPRPTNWGGYRLEPELMEFWQGRPERMHDRLRYTLFNGEWTIERLAP